jgi:predicted nucleic acid-binding protein
MVLADTSVWIAHLREGAVGLDTVLNEGHVLCHPFVIGELACGNLKNRVEILLLLQALPAAAPAEHDEVMQFIDTHGLMGKGLGYIDAHLLVSAALTQVPLWTLDKKLRESSCRLGLSYG